MLSPRPLLLGVAVMAAVLSAACGSPGSSAGPSASSSSASASPTPAAGSPFTATSFATVVPTGWSDMSSDQTEVAKFNSSGQVLFLAEQGPPGTIQTNVNDVKANINVLGLSTPVPDDQVAAYLASVSNHGATNLSAPQSFTIDGVTGQFITYNRDISGTPGESQDMVINHGSTSYDIVFNTSQYAFTQQLAGLQAVLSAWKWKS